MGNAHQVWSVLLPDSDIPAGAVPMEVAEYLEAQGLLWPKADGGPGWNFSTQLLQIVCEWSKFRSKFAPIARGIDYADEYRRGQGQAV